MPHSRSWFDISTELQKVPDNKKLAWLENGHKQSLEKISSLREKRNVIFYASAFLQKPEIAHQSQQITHEDINGFMTVIHKMDCTKGLTLILHTPGGLVTATETIVEYLHSKFDYIEVIVPTYAMSAGTMIALASNKIIMSRQSQLGPIDPQVHVGQGRFVSALSITQQFAKASKDIIKNVQSAHLWAPILQTLGPSLLVEAERNLAYSELIVGKWLAKRMFKAAGKANAKKVAEKVAKFFSQDSSIKNHGQRIDIKIASDKGLTVEALERDQSLQNALMEAYHFTTIIIETSITTKMIVANNKQKWLKSASVAT